MLDFEKVASFIAEKRREKGLTQRQVAEGLGVTFQAVSKWEGGATLPATELLPELARLLGVTVDEMLLGRQSSGLTYGKAGVDVHYTDALKREMGAILAGGDPRALGGVGPFASLYDIEFDDIAHPVLVLKSEEPGSKQKLAMEYGFVKSVCHDMINHLVNDVAVMGARPLAVLDTVVCGNAERETILSIISGISDACRQNECTLVGGETSVQPGIVESGTYILSASIAGIADRAGVIDGSGICAGDTVLAVASNGLHTNGYSLVRMLMNEAPRIKSERVAGEPFIDAIMRPHAAYYKTIKRLTAARAVKGMAHITGGGIEGNLKRIIPAGLCARVELPKIKTTELFRLIKNSGGVADSEMLSTFNCGVGLVLVVDPRRADEAAALVKQSFDCYPVGEIVPGGERVGFCGGLVW